MVRFNKFLYCDLCNIYSCYIRPPLDGRGGIDREYLYIDSHFLVYYHDDQSLTICNNNANRKCIYEVKEFGSEQAKEWLQKLELYAVFS
jgi:hypothetical protein